MISVLICSADNSLLNQVKANIEQTIGVEHEILFFDNLEKKGICEVYNSLAAQAKFSYLCFVHEDILFQTLNWGLLLAGTNRNAFQYGIPGYQVLTAQIFCTGTVTEMNRSICNQTKKIC